MSKTFHFVPKPKPSHLIHTYFSCKGVHYELTVNKSPGKSTGLSLWSQQQFLDTSISILAESIWIVARESDLMNQWPNQLIWITESLNPKPMKVSGMVSHYSEFTECEPLSSAKRPPSFVAHATPGTTRSCLPPEPSEQVSGSVWKHSSSVKPLLFCRSCMENSLSHADKG